MRVVVITTRHRPDDDRVFYKESLSLRTRYENVVLVAPASEPVSDFLGTGVRLEPITARGRGARIAQALGIARRLRPDVCHVHDLDLVPAIPRLRKRTGAKVVYDSHEVYPEAMLISPRLPRVLRPLAARVVDAVEKRAARRCALIVTADDPCSASFERTGVPVETIFNYPRLELFRPSAEEVGAAREQYGKRPVLLYQGSMGRERGLFQMVDALPLVLRDQPDVLLVLLGLSNRSLRAQAEARARKLGVIGSVMIEAWVPHTEIAGYMAAATLGLVPWQAVAKHEKNIPIKVFEYMACGLPVVASDLASIRRYVSASGAGVLYDPSSAENLASAVLGLLRRTDDRREMARRGREAVAAHWNWAAMESRLLDAYARHLEVG